MSSTTPVFFLASLADAIPPQKRTLETSHRLAILGDKPNAASFDERAPFAGAAGRLLWGALGRAGVPQQACYADNLSPTSPWQINETHLARVKADLEEFRPHLVLLLGSQPLNMFLSGRNSITDWRGSLFLADQFLPGQKCLATHHPTAIHVDYSLLPLVRFDFGRAANECCDPRITHSVREFHLEVSPSHAVLLLQSLQRAVLTSIDIEGGVDGLRCISFSQDPAQGFIVPWDCYTLEEQCEVAPALARVLGDPEIPKVLQNALYDNFVLSYVFKMPIRGIAEDTMLSGWEIYPELPKSLAVQASIWTKEPFWKGDKGSNDKRTLHRYCCTDSAVTLEIQKAHAEALMPFPARLAHYRHNVALLAPALYMSLRGVNYDTAAADAAYATTVAELYALQTQIDTYLQEVNPCPGCPSLNLHSPKQVCHVLYDILKYPVQHPKVGRRSDLGRRTADEEALQTLCRRFPQDQFLQRLVSWRHLDKVRSLLATPPDSDNRVRCAYNMVGDEAGSLTSHGSPLGAGTHLSGLPKRFRHLIRADDGHLLFECSLAKPREWTVAAHLRRFGDETLWNELVADAQPHPSVNRSTTDFYTRGSASVWRQWVKDQLMNKGTLESASGQLRTFFGRRDAASTLTDALAHEPAANAAFALGRALLRLWLDSDNRRSDGQDRSVADLGLGGPGRAEPLSSGGSRDRQPSLACEPLHVTVDGALLVQGLASERDWIEHKLRAWFANRLTIAGQEVVIPVEVRCGPNWGEMELC